MSSILYQVVSAFASVLVFIALVRPQTFRFLMDKGNAEPSLGRQGQFTALVVSTWAFVQLTLADKLTEWFFAGYMMAWGLAQFGSIWLKMKGQAQPKQETPT